MYKVFANLKGSLNFARDDRMGVIGVLTAIVLGTVLVMTALAVVLTGISSKWTGFIFNESEKAFIALEGCTEEALIQLSRDSGYTGDTYTIGGMDCTAVISGSGQARDVDVDGTLNDITHDIYMRVQVDPEFDILDYEI